MWSKSGIIKTNLQEVNLSVVLACGQSFRWKLLDGSWLSTLKGKVLKLRQDDRGDIFVSYWLQNIKTTAVSSVKKPEIKSGKRKRDDMEQEDVHCGNLEEVVDEVKRYLHLDISVDKLYEEWRRRDPVFMKRSQRMAGVRVLNQPVFETLLAFICSANNHIGRISNMVQLLAATYGTKLATIDGVEYYDFPTLNQMVSRDLENDLKALSFGYRAKYIAKTIKQLHALGGEKWLEELQLLEYKQARSELTKLCGVGLKVADCVCLMALQKPSALPVDTHVYQIAKEFYLPKLSTKKSVTDKVYDEIGDAFREIFGEYCGWAQGVLFASNLKQFSQKQ